MTVLVDTSVWVEYDRATGSSADLRLTELIEHTTEVCVTDPVVMEVAAGARTARREADLRRMLANFPLLRFDPGTHFTAASRIYRACRSQGVTPRGMVDCMIVAVAASFRATILAQDRDIARVAPIAGVTLET